MSDIRSFFSKPLQSSSVKEEKVKTKKKRLVILDSDDENDSAAPPNKKPQLSESAITKKSSEKTVPPKNKSPAKTDTTTSADDFFGSTVVHQKKRPRVQESSSFTSSIEKSSNKKSSSTSPKELAEVHKDKAFLETLNQIDNDKDLLSPKKKSKTSSKASAPVEKIGENKSPPNDSKTPEKKSVETNNDASIKDTPKLKKTPTPKDKKITPSKPNPAGKSGEDVPLSTEKKESTTGGKKAGYLAYLSYQNREGPKNLGAKKMPRGPDNCLEGKSFVVTGILESFERDEIKSFIERHGGKLMNSLSGKTSYIVIGREPGQAKVTKAEQLKTPQLDEDGLLALVPSNVSTSPDKNSSLTKFSPSKHKVAEPKVKKSPDMKLKPSVENKVTTKLLQPPSALSSIKSEWKQDPKPKAETSASSNKQSIASNLDTSLWVDKYQAKSMKQIIGQQGDKSNARKLHHWLQNWHKVFVQKSFSGQPSKDNGLFFRAALLSGVAGIGKTTTATIVAKELGFQYFTMNASDTRSQKLLNTVVAEVLKSTNISALADDAQKKHVLIMDEVDGMAGNEDRGGMAELINLIKKSKVPIICICNDRQHQKVRSLANYCFDLRFQRPRVEQLKSAMMSLCFKEGLKIQPNALEQLIIGANQDVRQIIHNLQAWGSTNATTLTYDKAKEKASHAKKDTKMGPFDACRSAFSFGEERRKFSFKDKLDFFFYDYSLMPLFMQENYLTTSTRHSQVDTLAKISEAADSIAFGDRISKTIRSTNNWSLLPQVGVYSCVIPGEACQGPMSQFINFPQWLGQNSKRSKSLRILQDLQLHLRLHSSCSKFDLLSQLLPVLRQNFSRSLNCGDGMQSAVEMLTSLDLTREDLDTIFTLSQMSEANDPWKMIASKDKAAFTRLYNKTSHKLPYLAVGTGSSKKTGVASEGDLLGGEEGDGTGDNNQEEESDVIPGLIAKKNPKTSSTSSTKGSKTKSSETKTSKSKKPKK